MALMTGTELGRISAPPYPPLDELFSLLFSLGPLAALVFMLSLQVVLNLDLDQRTDAVDGHVSSPCRSASLHGREDLAL